MLINFVFLLLYAAAYYNTCISMVMETACVSTDNDIKQHCIKMHYALHPVNQSKWIFFGHVFVLTQQDDVAAIERMRRPWTDRSSRGNRLEKSM